MRSFSSKHRSLLIDNIGRNSNIKVIISDVYGNYVIQKALKVTGDKKEPVFQKLLNLVMENIRYLDQKEYGKKLIKKLSNSYPEVKKFVNKYRRKHPHKNFKGKVKY